jgi:diguanylate cyclase (GGDEF)-like protein
LAEERGADVKKILVVEDNRMMGVLVSKRLQQEAIYDVVWLQTMKDAVDLLQTEKDNFFAALLDYNLPDAKKGEIVKEIVDRGIPAIVFSGLIDEEVREHVWSYKVVDYVLKEDAQSLNYILALLKKLEQNKQVKILIVDDSKFFVRFFVNLLKVQQFQTLTANSGEEALAVLEEHPDVKLVLTDYFMPKMDGLQLIQKIRKKHSREEMVVVGMSSKGEQIISARFIKNGANDFFVKGSITTEEFYSRIAQHVEHLEYIRLIKESAIKDFLTGLYNRRYFYDAGGGLYANARRDNVSLVCAMLDIDFFKKVNDTYGHDAGDEVLKHVASSIQKRMRKTDIVARLGGEEFCILAVNMQDEAIDMIFDGLRLVIASSPVTVNNGEDTIHVTLSIGVTTILAESLDEMVKKADSLLYEAKEGGRNRIVSDCRN